MNHISSFLKKSNLFDLNKKAAQKHDSIVKLSKEIAKIVPEKYQSKYTVLTLKQSTLTIEVERTWVTWIKSFEYKILYHFKQGYNINRIKWIVSQKITKKNIANEYTIYISDKSSKIIESTANNIQHENLKKALLKISNRKKLLHKN